VRHNVPSHFNWSLQLIRQVLLSMCALTTAYTSTHLWQKPSITKQET